MTRLRNIVVAAALALSCGAHAQTVGGNASLSVSSVSSRVALPAAGQTFRSALIAPASAAGPEVFYQLGNSSVVATTSNAALPSGGICVDVGSSTNVAAITATGTATLRITQATACPEFVSAANAANASVSATGSAAPGSATYVGVLSGGNIVGWNGAVSQSGTWTVQPGNTANTTPWLSTISQGGNSATVSAGGALKVDASASTQPISGTVTANQGGTWNINNIAGAISLPTGAATAANQTAVQGINGSAVPLAGVLVQGSDGTDARSLKTAADGTLKVDGSAVTQPVSAASLPLPSGAATAANQPAFGAAGTASADVITIQGIASMTAVKVDGSGVTQPVSGTVTANVGTTGGLALDATLTGGTSRSKITDGTNNAAVKAASTAAGAADPALVVAVSPNNSVAVTGTFWQATQPVSGSVTANAGTNLNTSLLALESGGNLATIATNSALAATSANQKIVDTWAGGTLGAMANYGTSPGAVLVPGVNAFITNSPTVVLSAETTKVIGTVNQGTSPWISNSTLQAGSAIVGKVGIDQTTPGTTNGVQVNAALPAGTNLIGKTGIDQTTPATTNGVTPVPTSATAGAVAPTQSNAAASNKVFKSGAGNLYSLTLSIGATSGWVMVFDATSLPANGATSSSLKYCYPVKSDGTVGGASFTWNVPLSFATGVTVGFSSTDCASITASATAYFYGQVM